MTNDEGRSFVIGHWSFVIRHFPAFFASSCRYCATVSRPGPPSLVTTRCGTPRSFGPVYFSPLASPAIVLTDSYPNPNGSCTTVATTCPSSTPLSVSGFSSKPTILTLPSLPASRTAVRHAGGLYAHSP